MENPVFSGPDRDFGEVAPRNWAYLSSFFLTWLPCFLIRSASRLGEPGLVLYARLRPAPRKTGYLLEPDPEQGSWNAAASGIQRENEGSGWVGSGSCSRQLDVPCGGAVAPLTVHLLSY
jgi:hypothetical protein